MLVLQSKQKTGNRILPFVTEYHPAVPDLENILMTKSFLKKKVASAKRDL